jgi:hypothetical protein
LIKTENVINESDLVQSCAVGSEHDLVGGSMTYLPINAPVECTYFCMIQQLKVDSDAENLDSLVGLLQKEDLTNPERPFNCFCVTPTMAATLLSRTVPNERCQAPFLEYEPKKRRSYVSLYKMVEFEDALEESLTLDIKSDMNGFWSQRGCEYFEHHEELMDGCNILLDDPHSKGFWSNCDLSPCVISAHSVNLFLQFKIEFNYFMMRTDPSDPFNPQLSLRYVVNETDWVNGSMFGVTEGWGHSEFTMPTSIFNPVSFVGT